MTAQITAKYPMLRYLVCLITALLLAVSCIKDEKEGEFELVPGDRIPDFTVQMNDGTQVTGASLRQGVSLIMFFHTSCPDCRNTLPLVQRIYDEFNGEVSFAVISREQPAGEIAAYWKEKGYTIPYSAQNDREIYSLFATTRVPRVFICSQGVIKSAYTDDPIPAYEDLFSDIDGLL